MINMKYVIVSNYSSEVPIIFSAAISHDTFQHLAPVSAGFVMFEKSDNNKVFVSCYGASQTLNLKSRLNEDAKLIVGEMNRSSDKRIFTCNIDS